MLFTSMVYSVMCDIGMLKDQVKIHLPNCTVFKNEIERLSTYSKAAYTKAFDMDELVEMCRPGSVSKCEMDNLKSEIGVIRDRVSSVRQQLDIHLRWEKLNENTSEDLIFSSPEASIRCTVKLPPAQPQQRQALTPIRAPVVQKRVFFSPAPTGPPPMTPQSASSSSSSYSPRSSTCTGSSSDEYSDSDF